MLMLRDLIIIASMPFLASVVLFLIFHNRRKVEFSKKKQQIIAGLVFGLVAIFATEYGVDVDGTIVNARDAAPLCAGLIFGPYAGIISGIIGGVERWFSVFWNHGYYTRLACTISTILTGFIAAFLRKNIFEDKIPDWALALYSGVFCETIHMAMIFLTNSNDIATAFEYISICSPPMILINALTVSFSCFMLRMMERDIEGKKFLPTIAFQFQRSLILIVMLGFVLTSAFTYVVQRQVAISNTFEMMLLNAWDSYNDVMSQVRSEHLRITREIAEDYFYDLSDQGVEWLADYYGVSEILIVNKDGNVIDSNHAGHIGALVEFIPDVAPFRELLTGTSEMAPYIENFDYEPVTDYRYAGIRFENNVVITAFDREQFKKEVDERLKTLIENRRIGEYGHIMIVDSKGVVIADVLGLEGKTIEELGLEKTDISSGRRRYPINLMGQDYYYMSMDEEYFTIYAFMPQNESDLNNTISTYLNIFMQIGVFGMMFIFIYYLTKHNIVNNIDKVNDSLDQITKGDLQTVVDVDVNEEFKSLSGGINLTVDALKKLISEANERIDSELAYAKEIQSSALDTNFPVNEQFELHALMVPAREVGGDFYDFYMINPHTLVFLVADVSGKGIPASLFMMRSKTMIRNYAEAGKLPKEILDRANNHLCEGNEASMFVTAWIGFLDLRNGELRYSNAGHNPPLLRKKDGDYEFIQSNAGFVLAAMENISYKEEVLYLEPGDSIFLYTDGVVEATDADKQLYGNDRLRDCLNRHKEENAKQICENTLEDVDQFFTGVPQFDDITELSLIFHSYVKEEQKG
ncbi:MAG: SpoIIE family protein phosphatase [Erysipelotrichaceae bacterium]|nr:SpoIIE family protein phosphatase [Erysipelotrichaceae bacterium]